MKLKEELSTSFLLYGTSEAQAFGREEGTVVRLTCYTGSHGGELKPSS